MDAFIKKMFESLKEEFKLSCDELTKLDSVGGDGDLGIVMMDGFSGIYDYVCELEEKDVGKALFLIGKKFNSLASSSMGTLISSGFMNIGKKLKGKEELSKDDLLVLVEGMGEGVQNLGKAKEGEKTFLDAIMPAARALKNNVDNSPEKMFEEAAKVAQKGVDNATNMMAVHGRLAFRKENSIGIVDPGTVAAYHYVNAIYNSLKGCD